MGFRRHIQDSPKIDLTPMVDVVFLLVIFFMISTTFVEQPGLSVDLPVAKSRYLKQDKRELRAYLAANGDIYLQREKVTWEEFHQKLSSYDADVTKKMTFIIMADENTRHGEVIRLMDAAKSVGIRRLVIATDDTTAIDH